LVSDEQARAAANEILSQGRFTRWDGDFEVWLRALEALIDMIPSWLIEVVDWIERVLIDQVLGSILAFLGRLLSLFGVFGETPDLLGWISISLILSVGVVLAYRTWGESWFETRTPESKARPTRQHADAIREARSLASSGHFLEAAHRVQLATLAMLIDSDVLELARSDPNRTLRHRVADSSLPAGERATLISLVDRLEALWFNEPREDATLFEEWIALDERLARVAVGSAK